MKKLSVVFTIALLLASMKLTPTTAETSENGLGKVIISFKDEIDHSVLKEMGAEVHEELESISSVIVTLPKNEINQASTEPSIEYVEEDQLVKAAVQGTTWGYANTKAGEALNSGYTGKGVKIAVLDSGININHPDLRVAGGISAIEGASPFSDASGHGTHVAGVIGALNNSIGVLGVAPDADIFSVKVLSSNGTGTLSDVLKGIDWAIQNGMDIINLSLTTDVNSPQLAAILQKAYDLGIINVAASGNNRSSYPVNDVLYPAKFSSVIAVGSSDRNNSLSSFSYYGPSLELLGPGENIRSTTTDAGTAAGDDYSSSSGTSVATPFVAGIFAQYKEAYPHLSNSQLRATIKRAAIDLGAKGKDNFYGHGLVQSIQSKAALFPDLRTNYWYTASIQNIFDLGIVTGFPDGTYRPSATITRADAVTMIGRALNFETDMTENPFKDVSTGSYAAGYISKAHELGYIKGITADEFYPSAPIKRGDMAIIIKRIFDLPHTGTGSFKDVSTSAYYFEAVQSAFENNIVQGYGDDTFRPLEPISRAENAEILSNALETQK